MDFDNALSDSMVKRVISFVVAVIIVSVVAIPVVNALTDENGSDGGDSAPITYTNSGDFYYKSATADSNEHTLKIQTSPGSTESTMNITVLSDNVSVYETEFTIPGDDGIVPASDSILLAVCKDIEYHRTLYLALSNMYGISWYIDENGQGGSDYTNPETDESGNMNWLFTIQNGKLTYTSEGESMTYDCLCYLSTNGEYVLANAPVKVISNNEIFAFGTTIVDDPEHSTEWAPATYSSFDAIMLENGNNTIPLVSQDEFVNETSADLSCTVTDVITVNSMSVDVSMSIDAREGTYHLTATSDNLNLLVPVTVTVGSGEPMEFTNVGEKYALADDSGTHTIHIAKGEDTSYTVTVDGAVSYPAWFGRSVGGEVTSTYLIANAKDGAYLEMTPDGRLDWIMIDNSYWNVTPTSVDGSDYTYDLTISNGVMSWNGKLLSSDDEVEHTTEIMYYVSNAGEYVYTTVIGQNSGGTSVPQIKMADRGMSAYIYTMEMVDVGNSWIWKPVLFFGQFDSTSLSNGDSSVELTWDTDYTVSSPTCVVQSSEKAGLRVITSIEVNANLQTSNLTQDYTPLAVDVFVPATITVSGGDEGGDSDSSSNMTNTIIKTIPIFLVLGLLIAFALPMVQGKFE